MDDILRVRTFTFLCISVCQIGSQTLSQFPHTCTSVKHVHLVESSPALCAVQEKKLRGWGLNKGPELHWHESIDDIPASDGVYTMLVAHEFFDALPFHLIEVRHTFITTLQHVSLTSSNRIS